MTLFGIFLTPVFFYVIRRGHHVPMVDGPQNPAVQPEQEATQ